MKKKEVLILATCILFTILTGCGTKNDTMGTDILSQTDKTQGETGNNKPLSIEELEDKEVAVGTILDAPEVLFDAETKGLYVYFTYSGNTANETASMELAVDQVNEDTYLIYSSDGLLKNHELVYEVTDAGVTKYYKDVFMSTFEQETESSQQQLEEEKNEMLSLLSYFMMQSSDYNSYQYRKSDASVAALTGEVYVYDVLENNECIGQICIDKATGVMVSLKDEQGKSLYTVQKVQISNVEIPTYK